ncbi:MAG: hypothetical protein HKN45_02100 [Flavobacteriales bacterium]|nr:hypothetical protein [Flavobacteriales bacterium]
MPNYLLVRSSLLLPLLAVLFLFQGCQKEESEADPQNNSTNLSDHGYLSGIMIQTHFRGLVNDEGGNPLSGVYISIGNSYTLTDDEGFWQILNASVDSERAYVKAQKPGYFTSGRVLHPHEDNFNRAFITLMSLEIAGSVNGQTGGEVIHSSGAAVDLPANGIVDENGVEYTGQVNVALCYIDPSSDDFFQEMPGDLTALEEDGDFKALISYGMIGVELQGIAGQELQLADGLVAQISVPLPSQSGPDPSSTIPLWHFDEDEGVWKEDGEASLVGNEYVGEVSHFSFWNCDIPTDYVFIEGKVIGETSGQPMLGVQINIVSNNFGTGTGYTNDQGFFGGIIPANEVLTLEIYVCGELVLSMEIGPFSEDTTLPPIEIPENIVGYITGVLVDCENQPTSGFVTINNSLIFPESVEVDPDGIFEFNINCSPQTFSIYGFDEDYETASLPQQVTSIPMETVDIGQLNNCTISAEQYVEVYLNGDSYLFADSLYTGFTGTDIWISVADNSTPGEFNTVTLGFEDSINPLEFYEENNISIDGILYFQSDDFNLEFTTYSEELGTFLEFNFNGTYWIDWNPDDAQVISGSARILRE